MGKWSQKEYDEVLVRKVMTLFEKSVKQIEKKIGASTPISDKRFRTFIQQLDPECDSTQKAFDMLVFDHFTLKRDPPGLTLTRPTNPASTSLGAGGLPIPADRRLPIRREPFLRRSRTSLSNLRRRIQDDEDGLIPGPGEGIDFSLYEHNDSSPPPISLSRARNPSAIPMSRIINHNNNAGPVDPVSPPTDASIRWLEEYGINQSTNSNPRIVANGARARLPRTWGFYDSDSDATSVPDEFDTLLDRPQTPDGIGGNRIIGRRRRRAEMEDLDAEVEEAMAGRRRLTHRARLRMDQRPSREVQGRRRSESPQPLWEINVVDSESPSRLHSPPLASSNLERNESDAPREAEIHNNRDGDNRRNGVVFDEVAMQTLFGDIPTPTFNDEPTPSAHTVNATLGDIEQFERDEERIRRELEDDMALYANELFGDIDRHDII
ncbi:hypothetical protein I302_103644 [Kwoniella bestiolae CBS 10118]|uniref:Uncharacterized protein n=1 Tax=Kwoniella bestiolae CBS 10118 TaxID=1296100 RepID=A0A1B9G916_9TREE|nr:hypothetical protein I302_02349 [Kwoniella bestiolae CBS 10118]OCF27507.1 hypothetical protein I302_02349 [Kwoniella bestiolae CBS 10118]